MNELHKKTFQELKEGMLVENTVGTKGTVSSVFNDVFFVDWQNNERPVLFFPSDCQDLLFGEAGCSNKFSTKVLSKEEIYEMLLSDSILHHVSLKAVRKIEKAVVTKLALEGGNNAVLP